MILRLVLSEVLSLGFLGSDTKKAFGSIENPMIAHVMEADFEIWNVFFEIDF